MAPARSPTILPRQIDVSAPIRPPPAADCARARVDRTAGPRWAPLLDLWSPGGGAAVVLDRMLGIAGPYRSARVEVAWTPPGRGTADRPTTLAARLGAGSPGLARAERRCPLAPWRRERTAGAAADSLPSQRGTRLAKLPRHEARQLAPRRRHPGAPVVGCLWRRRGRACSQRGRGAWPHPAQLRRSGAVRRWSPPRSPDLYLCPRSVPGRILHGRHPAPVHGLPGNARRGLRALGVRGGSLRDRGLSALRLALVVQRPAVAGGRGSRAPSRASSRSLDVRASNALTPGAREDGTGAAGAAIPGRARAFPEGKASAMIA